MTSTELRALSDGELLKQLDDLYQTLFNLRFQQTSGQLPDTNKLQQARRDIARCKFVLRERELAAQRGVVGAKGKEGG